MSNGGFKFSEFFLSGSKADPKFSEVVSQVEQKIQEKIEIERSRLEYLVKTSVPVFCQELVCPSTGLKLVTQLFNLVEQCTLKIAFTDFQNTDTITVLLYYKNPKQTEKLYISTLEEITNPLKLRLQNIFGVPYKTIDTIVRHIRYDARNWQLIVRYKRAGFGQEN